LTRQTDVLVDTSIFIDFFRDHGAHPMEDLIRRNRVRLSNIVRLEILRGVRSTEIPRMEVVFGGLKAVHWQTELLEVAEEILTKVKPRGFVLGIPDLLIAAEAETLDIPIWTKDRIFFQLEKLDLVDCFRP